VRACVGACVRACVRACVCVCVCVCVCARSGLRPRRAHRPRVCRAALTSRARCLLCMCSAAAAPHSLLPRTPPRACAAPRVALRRRRAPWMRSWRGPTLSSPQRRARSCCTTSRSCWRTGTGVCVCVCCAALWLCCARAALDVAAHALTSAVHMQQARSRHQQECAPHSRDCFVVCAVPLPLCDCAACAGGRRRSPPTCGRRRCTAETGFSRTRHRLKAGVCRWCVGLPQQWRDRAGSVARQSVMGGLHRRWVLSVKHSASSCTVVCVDECGTSSACGAASLLCA
jgi:hypothetical protein